MNWSDLPVHERLRRKFQMESDDEKRVAVTLPEVVVPGHAIEAAELPKQPREVYELLQYKGRAVAARHSQTIIRGTEFKSGKRKGELRPTKTADHYAVATVDYEYPIVHAVWLGDNLYLTQLVPCDERSVISVPNVTALKEWIREQHG